MIFPVVIAGGTGSRLWPLSRELHPKQYLNVFGKRTMLQQTLYRLDGIKHKEPIIVCNEEHRFIVAEQLREISYNVSDIILEPVGRNTAPAIAVASLQALASDPDALILVLAADHNIQDEVAFQNTVEKSVQYASQGRLVTFGIVPTSAETGYGYIQRGRRRDYDTDNSAFDVKKFVEKPTEDVAKKYLDSGEYYWNSGMFLFKASVLIQELERYAPEILEICRNSLESSYRDKDFLRLSESHFKSCPNISIDYALMEKTSLATVVPIGAGWSDIGSWTSLWQESPKDCNNNVIKGDVIALNTTNSYLHSEGKLIATVGVSSLIIVETKDAILVADQSKVQDVKLVVEQLKKEGRSEYKIHREVYRPWGKYDSIDSGQRDHVKRITVKPGEKLSLQMHHHRAEHWIVVSGTAKVTNGEIETIVTEDQSTYIPLGNIHALENPGKIPLEMIEVQTGSYLGEDDIIRFEDRYGRVKG